MAGPKLFFVAAEPSGDLLARETIESLKAKQPDAEISGIGGRELAKLGITSPIDIAPLSIVGLFDGLKVYGVRHCLPLPIAKLGDIHRGLSPSTHVEA